ncbi:response regulator [Candidatus Woesearchaeota archaeon]|nr:response regulator [Candidatus Woesearchaeota archaeon]
MNYYKRFKSAEKLPTILVVDDLKQYREQYAALAREFDVNVITASNVAEGIGKALQYRPEIIITDKDMPDGSGNELAEKVMEVYRPMIAGITGGLPSDFKQLDFKLPKSISDSDYRSLIQAMLENKEPAKAVSEFHKLTSDKYRPKLEEGLLSIMEPYQAVDLLMQGFIITTAINQGRDKIWDGCQEINIVELKQTIGKESFEPEKIRELLSLDDIFEGGKFPELAETDKSLIESLKGSPMGSQESRVYSLVMGQRARDLIKKLENKEEITLDEAVRFRETYVGAMK